MNPFLDVLASKSLAFRGGNGVDTRQELHETVNLLFNAGIGMPNPVPPTRAPLGLTQAVILR